MEQAMTIPEDDGLRAKFKHFNLEIEDAKRHFGQWDICDPVVWAIIRVVQAQNNLADAIDQHATYNHQGSVEPAITERADAIAALQKALEEEPRGFQ
jgi:hypothetical protein